ncbi:MAG: hypothetical protein EKK29_06110 [Hyphomicrobiales bacterium]|nr:MAG: hypothetical protein EKK29_06110 [Hyphomicrobiales bacterium]
MSFTDFVSTISNIVAPARSSAPPAASVGFSPAPRAEAAPAPAPTSFTPAPPPGSPTSSGLGISFQTAYTWELLPEPARSKFLALRDEANDVHSPLDDLREQISEVRLDLQKAGARVAQITREAVARLDGGDQPGLNAEREKVARLTAELQRLQARFDARSAAWRSKHVVVSSLEDYLRRAGGPFEMGPAVAAPVPSKGEGLLDVIARVRQKVDRLREDKQAIVDAPVPASQAKAVAVAEIERFAAKGRPNVVGLVDGASSINWATRYELAAPILGPDGRVTAFAGRDREQIDVWSFLCWLHKDQIVARVSAEIDAVADDASALSPETRAKKLVQASEALIAAEREEESAVMAALAAGYVVDRRPDCDPRAVLNIVGPAPAAAI